MNRVIASWVAGVGLIGLTLLTWQLAESDASVWSLAAVALLKVAVIAAVFLELVRSRPIWGAMLLLLVGGVLGGSAWLIGG